MYSVLTQLSSTATQKRGTDGIGNTRMCDTIFTQKSISVTESRINEINATKLHSVILPYTGLLFCPITRLRDYRSENPGSKPVNVDIRKQTIRQFYRLSSRWNHRNKPNSPERLKVNWRQAILTHSICILWVLYEYASEWVCVCVCACELKARHILS